MAQLTKAAILDAFVRLLQQTPMDQITVQAVTAECGISRNTFYYHYSDIYALLKAMLRRDMDELQRQRQPGEHASEGLRRLIGYISARQRMFLHIYGAVGHAAMEDYLVEASGELFMAYLRDAAEGLSPSEEDLDFICRSFQFMLIGILLRRACPLTCIHCGRCVDACPMRLAPLFFNQRFGAGRYDELEGLRILDCIECGSCAWSCPAHIPLVQAIRAGKNEVRKLQTAAKVKAAAEAAKAEEAKAEETTKEEASAK